MRNSKTAPKLGTSVVLVAVVAGGVASFATPAKAVLLISDNFTSTSNSNQSDLNQNLAARQTGALAPLTYSAVGNSQTGNTTTMRSGGDGNYLLTAFDAKGSLDQDFSGSLAQSGLTISVDVDPDKTPNSSSWSSIDLGEAIGNRFLGVNQNFAHLGMLFRANGLFQAFDGNTGVSGGDIPYVSVGNTSPGGVDGFANVKIVLTDPTDGNPLDGVGETDISVYAATYLNETVPFFTYVKGSGGYTGGYTTLSSNAIGGFDNFTLSNGVVPEPASLATLSVAGLALLGRRRRKA